MTQEEINEINRQIATWLGWKEIYQGNTALVGVPPRQATEAEVPDFCTSDSDAITLLPEMVKRRFWYDLTSHHNGTHTVCIGVWEKDKTGVIYRKYLCQADRMPAISAAICSAVFQVIRKEKEQ